MTEHRLADLTSELPEGGCLLEILRRFALVGRSGVRGSICLPTRRRAGVKGVDIMVSQEKRPGFE